MGFLPANHNLTLLFTILSFSHNFIFLQTTHFIQFATFLRFLRFFIQFLIFNIIVSHAILSNCLKLCIFILQTDDMHGPFPPPASRQDQIHFPGNEQAGGKILEVGHVDSRQRGKLEFLQNLLSSGHIICWHLIALFL